MQFQSPPRPSDPIPMERRRLGKTDMEVSVLGFGGSEIGYQRVERRAPSRACSARALDAGLNVIDTAECYEDSEELIGRAVGARRAIPPLHQVRARAAAGAAATGGRRRCSRASSGA